MKLMIFSAVMALAIALGFSYVDAGGNHSILDKKEPVQRDGVQRHIDDTIAQEILPLRLGSTWVDVDLRGKSRNSPDFKVSQTGCYQIIAPEGISFSIVDKMTGQEWPVRNKDNIFFTSGVYSPHAYYIVSPKGQLHGIPFRVYLKLVI